MSRRYNPAVEVDSLSSISTDFSISHMDSRTEAQSQPASVDLEEQEARRRRNSGKDDNVKPKRKWLRLDLKHHQSIFVTTFYRIWMYRRRHLMLTLLQILLPALILVGMTAYLGSLLKSEKKGWSKFDPVTEQQLYESIKGKATSGAATLYMEYPDTVFAEKYKEKLKIKLDAANIELTEITNKDKVVEENIRYHLKGEPEKFIGGIEIKNPKTDPDSSFINGIGDKFTLTFTIVMAHDVPGFNFKHRPSFFDLDDNKPQNYYSLLGLELAVCRTFYDLIKEETGSTKDGISISMQSMSYPPHKSYILKTVNHVGDSYENDKRNREELDSMLATILVLSMVPVFFTVVEGPVMEKEKGFKLYFQLMGYPRGAYWFSWILNQMIIQSLVIIIQLCLFFLPLELNTGKLIGHGDWRLWLVILLLYNFSCLSCFTFLAAYCRRGKMATYIGIMTWLLSFHILQSHMPAFNFGSGFWSFTFSCLLPSGCIHWAMFLLTVINTSTDSTWNETLYFTLSETSEFKLLNVIVMMIVDFFLYFLLTLYVDNLHPGPLEYPQPWNYFFEGIKCRFIDPNKDSAFVKATGDADKSLSCQRCADCGISTECFHIPVIEYQQISKKFHRFDAVFGVENVRFNVYSSRITVLLGHKDSGRTTLMRLTCGEYAPTSGTVLVHGYNVRRDTQKVQSFLSLCMERDLLCEYLTVMEHMQLIGRLKGLKSSKIKKQAKIILESVGLLSQGNDHMWRLVRWQRRVLCVAMALIGDSPILLLDCPTRGLDIDVKRQIWSMLIKLKNEGKTILVSSRDINEATEIGDRIVILSRGKLAGVGQPSRLEKLFETGYHLGLTVLPESNNELELHNFLQERIPTVRALEGGLNTTEKAINRNDWDKSQACLLSLADGRDLLGSSYKMGIASHDHQLGSAGNNTVSLTEKDSVSKPTIIQMGRVPPNLRRFGVVDMSLQNEYCFLLPSSEKANFPKLLADLEKPDVMLKLGIKDYKLIYHDLEKAYSEVDDFVDVLDATAHSQEDDVQFTDFEDKKAMKLFTSQRYFPNIPEEEGFLNFKAGKRGFMICYHSFWALVLKRVFYIIGNYQYAIIQIMAPVLITLIVIQSTSVYFHQHMIFTEVALKGSTELSASKLVPYRMNDVPDLAASNLLESLKKVVPYKEMPNIGTQNFDDVYNEKVLDKFEDEIIMAADFTKVTNTTKEVTALFSPYLYHAAPLSLLFMFNTILDYEFGDRKYLVEMSGKLLEDRTNWIFWLKSAFPNMIRRFNVDITLTVALAFGYFIFTSGFVIQPCAEKLNWLKRYQMYTLKWNGLYWLAMAFVDMIFNLVVVIILAVTIYYHPEHHVFRHPEFITLFVMTTLLGGFASIISSYFWSHYLPNHQTSYYATLSLNQFFGANSRLFIFLLYTIINFGYMEEPMSLVLQIIQPFTIPWNFYTAFNWTLEAGRCSMLDKTVKRVMCSSDANSYPNIKKIRMNCCVKNARDRQVGLGFIFSDRRLSANFAFLMSHCIIGILVLMYVESKRLRRKLFTKIVDKPPGLMDPNDEESVRKEEEQVEKIKKLEPEERDKYFIVEKLGTSTFERTILFPMSFVAEPGKCTAIVGPETCGLTILYKILAGLRAVSEGDVTYGGCSLLSSGSRRRFFSLLGLCPSEDLTIDKLTGLQLLKLFARLRGVTSENLDDHVDFWVRNLDLQQKIKKRCESYSSVCKKKLAVALAAIGTPSVMIFDEPMKDLDPVSREQVIKILEALGRSNCVVIILTHDLSGVQSICDKLIVLTNGQVQFCQNTEAMLSELSDEFCIFIEFKRQTDFSIFVKFKNEFESEMEGMTLHAEDSHSLVYRIKSEKYNWINLFEILEKTTQKYPEVIQDYHIRKASLQDVYDKYISRQRILRSAPSTWDEFMNTYC